MRDRRLTEEMLLLVNSMFDVIIVGAGPAGLNAALVLGRSRRRVLVCDTGKPRNAASQAMHGFLTRDVIHPAEIARIGREQLAIYDTVELRDIEVRDIVPTRDQFAVTLIYPLHLKSWQEGVSNAA